jgi:hypothetical protein
MRPILAMERTGANDFHKSCKYPLELKNASAMMPIEADSRRGEGLIRIHFKGAFERVLSFRVEAQSCWIEK